MKKILFFFVAIISCCSISGKTYSPSFVLTKKMSIEEIVVNYPIIVFHDNPQTKNEILKLAMTSPSKFNFFVIWSNDNIMTYRLIYLSEITHKWVIESFTKFKCLEPGVRVFSRE